MLQLIRFMLQFRVLMHSKHVDNAVSLLAFVLFFFFIVECSNDQSI